MGRTSDAKHRLIETALKLIWERSYRNAGVNEICSEAGVKPGSFYYFFRSKEELVLCGLDYYWERTQALVFTPKLRTKQPPLRRLAELFRLEYQFYANEQKNSRPVLGCAVGSLVGELSNEDESIRHKAAEIFGMIKNFFADALKDAVAQGDLRLSTREIDIQSDALLAYYEGVLLLARTQNNASVIRKLGPGALRLISY